MDLLKKCLSEFNIDIDKKQLELFSRYYELLIEWNNKFNLTSITQKDDVIIKHFADSLALLKYFDPGNKSLIDIGTGAGFPGIPIKIMVPDCKILLLDSLNKRINFLDEVITSLGLDGISTVHGRAEDMGHDPDMREKFDLALSRAVANLSTLSEYCLPFVNINGLFISYKSGNIDDELSGAQKAIKTVGGSLEKTERFSLPYSDQERSLVFISKKKSTPSVYPRKAGVPGKKPL